MRRLLALLLFLVPGLALATSSYTCTNSASADAAGWTAGLASGGTFTVTGPICNLTGGGFFSIPNSITVNASGSVQVNGNGTTHYQLQLNGNNVTIHGFVFNAISIHDTFSNSSYSSNSTRHDFIFTGNTIQNVTNGDDAINADNSFWYAWLVDSNSFINISSIPIASWTTSLIVDFGQFNGACAAWTNGCAGRAIANNGGYSGSGNVTFTNNHFDTIFSDGINIQFGGNIGCAAFSAGVCITPAALNASSDNHVASYNTFVRVHRMALEDGGSNCVGGCAYGLLVNVKNWKLAGNYGYDFEKPYFNTYGISYNGGTMTPQFINNTFIIGNSPGSGAGYGFEVGNKNETLTGNVCAMNTGRTPFDTCFESGYPGTGYNDLQQNNYIVTTLHDFGYGDGQPNFGGTWTTQYNQTVTACDTPSNCAASTLTAAFISANNQTFPTGGNGTWTFYTHNQISTKWVQFFIDSNTTPVVTQELIDQNTNYTADRRFLYHATFSTTGLSGGAHTLKAIATDVSGAQVTVTQNFTTGSGPGAQFAPIKLSFGVITVGSSSSPQVTTLTNTGTTTLNITGGAAGVTITGANPGDFSRTTTCTATLAAAATCTVTVTFTPTIAGARTASISITDNASGSPHTVALIGGPPPCNGIYVTNCDFSNGSTGWTFNSAPFGTIVVDGTGPNGTNAAHITATSSVPPGSNIEIMFPGISYPPNGTVMKVQFDANTTSTQQLNVATGNSSTFVDYGLFCQPNVTNTGWATYICGPFTVTGSPAAGDGFLSIQADNATPGNEVFATNVSLIDVGTAPIASLSTNTVSFSAQVVGHTGTASPVTITNTGSANLVISSVTITGANASDFGQTNTCVGTIAAAGTCTITATFTPSAPTSRTAAIKIADNDGSSPQTINLIGTGDSHLSIRGFDSLDHSVVRLIVDSDFVIAGLHTGGCTLGAINTGCIGRTRSVERPGSCLNNTNGILQPQEIGPTYSTQQTPGTTLWMDVAGLYPAAVGWSICPEISRDGGVTWTGGVEQQIITTPLPAEHPEPPIAPKQVVNWLYPDTSNPALWTTVTLASDCSDLGPQYVSAVAQSLTKGTVMLEPIGTTCGTVLSGGNLNLGLKPPDVVSFASSDVNFAASQITLHGPASSVVVGEGLRFGLDYKANQSWPASTSCEFGQGLVTGQVFYVDSVITPATNTIKLLCGDKLTKMVFTNAGTDGGLPYLWVPEIRTLHKIILRSAAPDNQLPPPGVLITHDWDSKMANVTSQLTNLNVKGPAGALFTFTNNDGNNEWMVSDLTIGPGIRISHVDSAESHQTSDPLPWWTMALVPPSSSNIIFDRTMWDMGYNSPVGDAYNRMASGILWDGYNQAIVNSYFDNINYFHAEVTGGAITQTGSLTFSVASGIVNEGIGNVNFPATNVTLVGGSPATHGVYVGLDMTASNVFTVWTPSGMTASCSPACVNKTTTTTWTATCDHNDAWQKNGNGNPTVGEIGCVDVSPTIINSRVAIPYLSAYATEGTPWLINGLGPGPWFFYGNFTKCAGLCYHQDDGGNVSTIRANSTWLANYFLTPFQWMHYPANLALNPLSDGLSYYERQPWEAKAGRNNRLKGNIFDGNYNDVEASAGNALFTSVDGMGIRDIDLISNTLLHGPGIMSLGFVTAGSNFAMTPPVLRYRAENNFAWDIGNAAFHAGRQALPPPGWYGEGPNASQDVIIKNNTFAGNIGTNTSLMWNFDLRTEGVDVENNILYINSANQGVGLDGTEPSFHPCSGMIGKPLADCIWPGYIWKNNLMIGNGQTPSAVATAWTGLTNYFQTGSSSLTTVGWQNYTAPPTNPTNGLSTFDACMAAKGPWVAGSTNLNDHSHNVGVDCDRLKRDQQQLTNVHVPDNLLTSTSATVAFTAPNTDSCYVDYATEPTVVVNPTRIKDAGGNPARNVVLPSLTTKTQYWYRVMCQGNIVAQAKGSFTTR